MIKDKHSVRQPHQPAPVQESLPEEVSENPFVNMYQAGATAENRRRTRHHACTLHS